MNTDQGNSGSILSRAECLALLGRVSVGRIGASIDALPVIVPVYFTLSGESVLFRTVPGTRLDAATVGTVVAFQADEHEPRKRTHWSVLVQGKASEVLPGLEDSVLTSGALPRWNEPSRLVRVHATNVTGRRFAIAGEGPQSELPEPPSL